MELHGKVVVITGTSNGIGRACAKLLASNGCYVYGLDIDQMNGQKLVHELEGHFCFIKADVSEENELRNALSVIKNRETGIDILINNAAIQSEADFFSEKAATFKKVIMTNLVGTFMCSQIFGKEICPYGKIVNMLSVHSIVPRVGKYAYDASKAGILMLTKELALALAPKNINVMGISYGACHTQMNKVWDTCPTTYEIAKSKIPLGWIAEPEEIARFLVVILKEFSDYSSGAVFTIDGGRSLTGN